MILALDRTEPNFARTEPNFARTKIELSLRLHVRWGLLERSNSDETLTSYVLLSIEERVQAMRPSSMQKEKPEKRLQEKPNSFATCKAATRRATKSSAGTQQPSRVVLQRFQVGMGLIN